jgi:hypothetical protein
MLYGAPSGAVQILSIWLGVIACYIPEQTLFNRHSPHHCSAPGKYSASEAEPERRLRHDCSFLACVCYLGCFLHYSQFER